MRISLQEAVGTGYSDFWKTRKRYRVCKGSRGSKKSKTTALNMIYRLKSAGKAMLNNGICWLYPYYTEDGDFSFRMFPGYEVLPFWKDTEHTILEAAVRLYPVVGYQGSTPVIIEKVEIYDLNGVHRYILEGTTLVPDFQDSDENTSPYSTSVDENGNFISLNWSKVPLIPLKYNECEIPLLKKVKTLQDGINVMLSDFENNMQEDARNTILVLKNYDGTDLGEFRKNLATYGAVKVRYDGETKGGVETLEINVNAENNKAIIEIFKKAIIENGMGYDAKDDRLSGNPNQMNIQSMYSDHGFADDVSTSPYKDTGICPCFGTGYISAFGYSEEFDWLFVPTEKAGNSALPVGDFFWNQNPGWGVAVLGACWDSGASAGAFCLHLDVASADRARVIGGRLVYVPSKATA